MESERVPTPDPRTDSVWKWAWHDAGIKRSSFRVGALAGAVGLVGAYFLPGPEKPSRSQNLWHGLTVLAVAAVIVVVVTVLSALLRAAIDQRNDLRGINEKVENQNAAMRGSIERSLHMHSIGTRRVTSATARVDLKLQNIGPLPINVQLRRTRVVGQDGASSPPLRPGVVGHLWPGQTDGTFYDMPTPFGDPYTYTFDFVAWYGSPTTSELFEFERHWRVECRQHQGETLSFPTFLSGHDRQLPDGYSFDMRDE